MFVIAVLALVGVIGTLLWYTDWAEARVIAPDAEAARADRP